MVLTAGVITVVDNNLTLATTLTVVYHSQESEWSEFCRENIIEKVPPIELLCFRNKNSQIIIEVVKI